MNPKTPPQVFAAAVKENLFRVCRQTALPTVRSGAFALLIILCEGEDLVELAGFEGNLFDDGAGGSVVIFLEQENPQGLAGPVVGDRKSVV